ncbi:MAG: aminomethyl-transferring glycine dehydrogenase [Bacteroidetes bacterium]|nr:aminomethyl-transferring glycine dehydrogenase [Bacteroidota bacterium]
MITDNFTRRHNGPRPEEVAGMIEKMNVSSLDALIDETIPPSIRLKQPLNLGKGMNEYEVLRELKELGSKNVLYKTFIGLGYYNTITPGIIQRNILENPGWYTSYTPYQAEISQGRLEALLNYQTVISDMTGMPIANASLLDEATAAAEAMIMFFNNRSRDKVKANSRKFFASDKLFPQTLDVLQSHAGPLNIDLIIGDHIDHVFTGEYFGAMIQYPDQYGNVADYSDFVAGLRAIAIPVAVASDLMSLALMKPPSEWGASVVFGSSQRFGIPLGYGGPSAGFFATTEEYKRGIPGRIIGISHDNRGNIAYRMALGTREQHIKREKATSNICTAQALLAIMSGMYAAWHGPAGIRKIARHINILTGVLSKEVKKLGYTQDNEYFFDTVRIGIPSHVPMEIIEILSQQNRMNFRIIDDKTLCISIDETTTLADINIMLSIFCNAAGIEFEPFVCNPAECELILTLPVSLQRTSPFLTHPVFNTYHSETEMMRYMKKLEIKDLSLNRSMIPLGSCTMKLNAAVEMFHLSWPEFAGLHPFVPASQAQGYHELIRQLGEDLKTITGFSGISFQPNSGAAGEYTGLMVIRAYHRSRGDHQRRVCLIPCSAHGTNPASSVMAGMEVVVVKCDPMGNIDMEDLKIRAEQYKDTLAAIMVTYPSTHGVFEEAILELVDIIHRNGGQVYMDGANMNAQVGYTNPATIGADVCHLNLHKTFAIPHGGGGPGVGPICVASHLVPFLPGHSFVSTGGKQAIPAVAASPFGSAFILPISYAYIKLLGGEGLKLATAYAILNANYLKSCLEKHYPILYTGIHNRVAHEMILDCNQFSHSVGIQAIDIAKRLMDYGFHAPTVAFPVHGTLMVEPTESEPLHELDRFIQAMISIRKEINDIEEGKADKDNNLLKNAPHTYGMAASNEWPFPYSREEAVFPTDFTREDKYWPSVTRIDDAFGDRNLVCTCSL